MITQQGTAIPSIQQASQAERIAIVCPSCEATLSVRRIYVGHQILCKQCSHTFLLRDSAKPQPMSADDSDDDGDMLQTGLDELKYEQVERELRRVTTDLDRIRAHLGTVAPEDVRDLAEERESLRAEANRLSDANEVLRSEISTQKHLAAELERRESDLTTLRDDCHRLGQQLKQRDDELNAVRAERESLGQQLKQSHDDIAAARVEHGLLRTQLQDALNEVDQSRMLVERARAVHNENDQLRAAVDSLRQALALAEQDHLDDLNRLKDQLDPAHEKDRDLVVLRDQYSQLRADVDTILPRVEDLQRRLDVAERLNRDMVELPEIPRIRSIPV
jgi:chromosome segregation ATPase